MIANYYPKCLNIQNFLIFLNNRLEILLFLKSSCRLALMSKQLLLCGVPGTGGEDFELVNEDAVFLVGNFFLQHHPRVLQSFEVLPGVCEHGSEIVHDLVELVDFARQTHLSRIANALSTWSTTAVVQTRLTHFERVLHVSQDGLRVEDLFLLGGDFFQDMIQLILQLV